MARHFFIWTALALAVATSARAADEGISFRNQLLEETDSPSSTALETEDVGRLRVLADQGVAQAQYHLGLIYWHGQGVERDIFQAIDWLRKAADQNHLEAEYNLGKIFLQGNAMEDAANWFTRAALHGHAGAQNSLGRCYVTGMGVKQDTVQAYAWWLVAARSGSKRAEQNRAKLQNMFTRDELLQAERLAESLQSRIRSN